MSCYILSTRLSFTEPTKTPAFDEKHRQFFSMRYSPACIGVGLLSVLAVAHPVEKRANALPPVDSATDESVVQLALYLEHLELSLYTGGYENFTDEEYTAAGFPSGFRDNVGVIAQVNIYIHSGPALERISTDSLILNSTKPHTLLLSVAFLWQPVTLQCHHAHTPSHTTLPHPSLISPT